MTEMQENRLALLRRFFADYVAAKGGVQDARLTQAFHSVDRAHYCGPGPWWVAVLADYIQTPSDDLAFIYQDTVVGLMPERGINNGEPSFHARCLNAVKIQPGERVVHVGSGAGYYTALLAELVGPSGAVTAYEIEPVLAARAAENLGHLKNVQVQAQSGAEGALPAADVIYVNAGATEPLPVWLEALKPGGRLIFPLTPDHGFGGMLLVSRTQTDQFDARFVSQALFFPCLGARREATARALWEAFRKGTEHLNVRSLHRAGTPDASCWAQGQDWWLSTRANTHMSLPRRQRSP